MLRLMGLPAIARFPRVAVGRQDDTLELLFMGRGGTQQMDVPLALLDDEDDAEAVELRLLAQLQALGYAVERVPLDR